MQASAEKSQAFVGKIILPLSLLVLALLLAALGGLFWIADYQTRIAIDQQARLARGALRIHAEKLAVSANDYGYWDEALNALVDHPNYDWMRDNIGSGAAGSLGTDMAFVIDNRGDTTFSYMNRIDAARDTVVPMPTSFRAAYDDWKRRPQGESFSGLQPFGGTVAAIAIAPVRSSSDAARPATGFAIVFVDLVDAALLVDLSRDFELANFRPVRTAADVGDERAVISVAGLGPKTETVARFGWDPQKPGNRLLKIALPFATIFVLVLSALAAVLVRHIMASARLISDRETKAYCDPLTGLANRTRFFSELDRNIRQIVPDKTGVAVMYIDLDGFKSINDTLGHSAGDELLVLAAERFKFCLRSTDLVARLGGDEFAIIMSGRIERAHVQAVGARILSAVAEPFRLRAGEAVVGCSIGIADCFDQIELSADVLNRADKALYQVKATGKNALRFADLPTREEQQMSGLRVA